jgi:nicotinate-nucleotide adenylyltransferase
VKIALFGGTFDPIHSGHLEIARAAADAYGLDRVLFVTAGSPPHKYGQQQASWERSTTLWIRATGCTSSSARTPLPTSASGIAWTTSYRWSSSSS